MLSYRPSELDDCSYLAKHIRKADLREITDTAGHSPLEAFVAGYNASLRPLTIMGDVPVGMAGAVPVGPSEGVVWMLGTEGIKADRVSFIRQSRGVLNEVCEPFDWVSNCVDKRNTLHLKWLSWLGFSFLREVENFGINKITVYEFARVC